MSSNTRAGTIVFKMDQKQYSAKGSFKITKGGPKKNSINGADEVHGFSEEIVTPAIEGMITDAGDLSIETIQALDASVTLQLKNGKSYVLNKAWYAGEGELNTETGEIPVLLHGKTMTEVTA